MANNPEEFFVNCLMHQSSPSPSVFLDPPLFPDGCSEGRLSPNDNVLPYVSYMLMEDDDIEDKHSDHPALLQVQQPFAEILFGPSFGTDMGNNVNRGNTQMPKDLLQDGSCDQMTTDSGFAKGAGAVRALFLKGMEESKMFLPKYDNFREIDPLNQSFRESTNNSDPKTSYSKDDHLQVVSIADKAITMTKETESVDVCVMLDEMKLPGYDKCMTEDMEKLRITMANEVEKNSRKGCRKTMRVVVDLPMLLTYCAQAVAANNYTSAWQLLKQIKQHTSTTGTATQRLAQCFAKGLEARLLGTVSKLWQFRMVEQQSIEYREAYYLYVAACCFDNVALSFSVMTIMDTVVGKSKLHILDYGLDYELKWAGLLRLLAEKEGGSPEVKITAICHPEHRSYPAEPVEEAGRRLYQFALELGLPSFKFRAIRQKWEDVCIKDLDTESNEVLIVNDHFHLSTLMDESVYFDGPNPRDTVLNNIRKMRPAVFIQSIVNCTYGSSFASRFKAMLFYYMALFDMLDATIPRESKRRVVLEQGLFGWYALNVIASEGVDVVRHPEKYVHWQARNQRAGLRQIPLKQKIVKELANKVRKHHKDFLLSEDGQWLLQGWRGRILFAHSIWVAEGTL